MKISKIFLATVISVNLFTLAAFAAPTLSQPTKPAKTDKSDMENTRDKDFHLDHKKCRKGKCSEEFKDPIKSLKVRKEKIIKLEKEGKISKEEADKKIKKIDSKIKGIEEFNKLTVEQKREKIIEKFKEVMASQVKDGKISQEKANELISEYTKKIQEWDGNGMPKFYYKQHNKGHNKEHNKQHNKEFKQ